jgi:salicylate hydroxylase
MKSLRIGIVGAGIGGVALSRALRMRGIESHLFERTAAFGEIGAGVQMTPNSVKVLRALGLGPALERDGFLPEAIVGFNWQTKHELFRTPLRGVCPRLYGDEYYQVHRADLHAMLVEGIPADRVTFNVRCVGIEHGPATSTAIFADGTRHEADLIVGADGIHSAVRNALFGADAPRFTGHMCWRAIVPVPEYPLPFVGPYNTMFMGPSAHVVTYYVKAGRAVNIVAVKDSEAWVKESWTEPSTADELIAAYEGWHPDLVRLLERAQPGQTFKWGLFDRDPMERWSVGRTTLLGDAAHPMLPFLSQGAAMGVEDAFVLAEALVHFAGDVPAALAAYEAERRPRTARVQLESRERGRTYHLATPEEAAERDRQLKEAQAKNPNAVGIRAEWVYEYDARTCRERFPGRAAA